MPVANPALPAVPRHYGHIRVAALAYYGTPMTAFEQKLLRESIDLVIPNISFLNSIAQTSPTTPQLVYTNTTNLYLSLLTDWLAYADRNRYDRESDHGLDHKAQARWEAAVAERLAALPE